jgi:pimeloyl-ACP methyl ester carboxylesterase
LLTRPAAGIEIVPNNILYLHGFASGPGSQKGRYLHSQFAVLGGEVHQPDLTEGNFAETTISRQLKVVDREVRRLAPVLIIGSSLGGYLAALYAALQPDLVQRMALLAPGFGIGKRLGERIGEDGVQAWKETGTREFYHYGERRMLPLSFAFYEDAQWHDDNPAVEQPTLIVHGRWDDVVPAQQSVAFAWGKPNVQLELVDSDHQLLDALPELWLRLAAFYHESEPSRGVRA